MSEPKQSVAVASSLLSRDGWWISAQASVEKLISNARQSARFMQIVHTMLVHNPKLGECTVSSFAAALFEAARLNLEPGGVGADCYILPYHNSKAGIYEAQFQMGYLGFVKMAARISIAMRGGMIYSKDKYRIVEGSNPSIDIEPAYGKDRGQPILAWAAVDITGQKIQFAVHDRAEAERRRVRSPSVKSGRPSPWDTDYNAMWLKGAFRQVGKFISHADAGLLRQAAVIDEYRESGVRIEQQSKPEFVLSAEADAASINEMPQRGAAAIPESPVGVTGTEGKVNQPGAAPLPHEEWIPKEPSCNSEVMDGLFTGLESRRTKTGKFMHWLTEASGDKFSTFDAGFANRVPLNEPLIIAFERKEVKGKTYLNLIAVKSASDKPEAGASEQQEEQEPPESEEPDVIESTES